MLQFVLPEAESGKTVCFPQVKKNKSIYFVYIVLYYII